MRRPVRARVRPATRATTLRTGRGRVRALIVAIVAPLVLAIASGTAFARTSATRLESGVVVIETKLAYQHGAAAGTGMVLTSSGEILTNNHVIRGATTIKVVVPNTGRTYTARVVGYAVGDDVAILQVVGASNMTTVTTATSMAALGDAVTAIGNANGTGKLTSTTGAVTRRGASVVVNDDQGGAVRLTGMLGVNASVVPGDSGGPLVNSAGEVIGMDTAGSTGTTFRSTDATQAYAVPIAKALSIAKKVAAGTGSIRVHIGETAFMGVQVQGGDRGDPVSGAVIAGITNGAPAASAGLAPGDVITAVDGYHISTPASLTSSLLTKKPGDGVTIAYADQSGARHSLKLVLASGPPQ
jgi:S1-C subfamily serine protease